jgi:hypothetical protein
MVPAVHLLLALLETWVTQGSGVFAGYYIDIYRHDSMICSLHTVQVSILFHLFLGWYIYLNHFSQLQF